MTDERDQVIDCTLTLYHVWVEMISVYRGMLSDASALNPFLIRVAMRMDEGTLYPTVHYDGELGEVEKSIFQKTAKKIWSEKIVGELGRRLAGVRSRRDEQAPRQAEASASTA